MTKRTGIIFAAAFPLLLGANLQARAAGDGGYGPDIDHPAKVVTAPGGISYITGGIGKDSAQRLDEMARGGDFNVKMTFSWNKGNYVADVPVKIEDASGNTVLEVAAADPILLVKLPLGQYTATARYDGAAEKRAINVGKGGQHDVHFTWAQPQG